MSILVKLSTTLRDYVPGYDPEAGITLDAPEDATAADVARMVGLPLEEIKIVMINGRQKEVQSKICDGARVAFFLLSEEVRRPLIMTPITSPSPGEGECSAAFPPWTASGIRERLGAFLHGGSLASWAGPHVLRRAADGTPFVSGTAIRQLAAGAVLPEREVMVALLQDGIWPERFRRNYGVFSADAMVRLLQTRVFVLGCGGLGGHVASLLARLGVGGLRLCDSDIFEESNLNRQYFCTESTLGQPKAVATARGLRDMAGYLALDVRHVEADEKNLPDMLQDVDVALDCLDDLALKMLLEERSAAAGVPFVHGSVLRAEGFARAARSGRLHLRELYASGLTSEEAGSARHEGVIATAPAGVACLMVSLCLRLLLRPDAGDSALFHADLSVPELERFEF